MASFAKFGKFSYSPDHFAYQLETEKDTNFVIAVRDFEDKEKSPIDVIAILLPEDQRGWRIIVKLVDRTDMNKVFNREFTSREYETCMALAQIVFEIYKKHHLIPQLREDGFLSVSFDESTKNLIYGNEREPHRLFVHVLGRHLHTDIPLPVSVPFVNLPRQFALSHSFEPWYHHSHIQKVAEWLRGEIRHKLDQRAYNVCEYHDLVPHQLIKEIKPMKWIKFERKEGSERGESERNTSFSFFDGLKWKHSSQFPYLVSNTQSRPLPPRIKQRDFKKWHHREKLANRIILETKSHVIWRDLKENDKNLYWVVYSRNCKHHTMLDLKHTDVDFLVNLKQNVETCLSANLKTDSSVMCDFNLVVHHPPSIGRFHVQVVPKLSSPYHSNFEHLYTLADFSITLDMLISTLKKPES